MPTAYTIYCSHCKAAIDIVHTDICMAVCTQCSAVHRKKNLETWEKTEEPSFEAGRSARFLALHLDPNDGKGLYQVRGGAFGLYGEHPFYFFSASDGIGALHNWLYYNGDWINLQSDNKDVFNEFGIDRLTPGKREKSRNRKETAYLLSKEPLTDLQFFGQSQWPVHFQNSTIFFNWLLEESHYWSSPPANGWSGSWLLQPATVHLHGGDASVFLQPLYAICSNCKQENSIPVFPFSQSFICIRCGMGHSLGINGLVKKIRHYPNTHTPSISLGATGSIDATSYAVTGFAVKEDSYGYTWREYTLWNQDKGFAYLSEYRGHWVFLQKTTAVPPPEMTNPGNPADHVEDGEENYTLFNEYRASLLTGSGCFSGNIMNDGEYRAIEYIAPPQMRSFEKIDHEGITAYTGKHIEGAELEAAFGQMIQLPAKSGIGAVQPVGGGVSSRYFLQSVAVIVLLLLLFQLGSGMFNKNEKIYQSHFNLKDSLSKGKMSTPVFELEKFRSNLKISFGADVNNSWLELGMELVNTQTGKTQNFEKGIEYYSGYSGGESWTEGSRSKHFIISSLPRGRYQLHFTPVWDTLQVSNYPFNQGISSYWVHIEKDVPLWRNFLIGIILLAVPSLIFGLRMYYIEKSRWSNSPFANTEE